MKQKTKAKNRPTEVKKSRTTLPSSSSVLTTQPTPYTNEIQSNANQEQKLRTNKVSVLTEKEEKILEAYGNGGAKYAAQMLGTTVEHVYQRIHRIKKKVEKAQNFLNRINSFRARYPRIKKSMLIIEKEIWEK